MKDAGQCLYPAYPAPEGHPAYPVCFLFVILCVFYPVDKSV